MIMRIIAVGKLKEKYWKDGVDDYLQRLGPYARIEILEIPDAKMQGGASPAEEKMAIEKEGASILRRLEKAKSHVIALDRKGKSISSLGIAKLLEDQILNGKDITWIIGGPLGLDNSVIERADLTLSFSDLTFPHQMIRMILIEQIYRAYKIISHEPYHK